MAKKAQEQQAVRPGVLIAVAAVGAAAVAFFIVNMLMSHSGKGSAPAPAASAAVQSPGSDQVPNITVPKPPPLPPSSGRDPFQPVVNTNPATPAPVAPAAATKPAIETPNPTTKPEFKDTAYVQVVSISADHKTAQIKDGSVVYTQARPGQTLDRSVVFDSVDSAGCAHLHRGTNNFILCRGDRVLM